jgi:hypothetical protein
VKQKQGRQKLMFSVRASEVQEQAAPCLRIARRLSWNNPGRLRLTELAQRFDQQARDLDPQTGFCQSGPQSSSASV